MTIFWTRDNLPATRDKLPATRDTRRLDYLSEAWKEKNIPKKYVYNLPLKNSFVPPTAEAKNLKAWFHFWNRPKSVWITFPDQAWH